MNDKCNNLLNYIGMGNPESDYWFIGIEEAKVPEIDKIGKISESYDWEMRENWYESDLAELRENKNKKGFSGKFTSVYTIMAKTITSFNNIKIKPREYINKYLFFEKGSNFQINLYPIGRNKNTDMLSPEILKELEMTEEYYYKDFMKTRKQKVLQYINQHKPTFIICFGIGHWNDYRELFVTQKENFQREDCFEYQQIELDTKKSLLILAPFFDNRNMSNKRIAYLVEIMKGKAGASIPDIPMLEDGQTNLLN